MSFETVQALAEFDATNDRPRYAVDGYSGVAFYLYGIETQNEYESTHWYDDCDAIPYCDDEYHWDWQESESETGNVLMIMVGDDRQHSIDPIDVSPIPDGSYCSECGQIGCSVAPIE